MGICNECLYFDVCNSWHKELEEEGLATGAFSQHKCKDFKNKADMVEVVRCKDCEYFYPFEYIEQQGMCEHCSGLNGTDYCVSEDDFCSYGERKGNNDN